MSEERGSYLGKTGENLFHLLAERPIAYHRAFADLGAGVNGAVFLSQLFYWSNVMTKKAQKEGREFDGWIYKTQDEWTEETGLSRREQETVRRHLIDSHILEEKLKGVPARLYYKVDIDTLAQSLLVKKCQPSMAQSAKLDWLNQPNINKNTETTTETTKENIPIKENYEIQVEDLEEIPQSYRELSNTFTRSTGILLYRNQEWDQAITDMLANGVDPGLLDQAIQKLRGARMTISGPWSVAKTAIGLKTEQSVNSFEVANG